jgi:hypothetical protein
MIVRNQKLSMTRCRQLEELTIRFGNLSAMLHVDGLADWERYIVSNEGSKPEETGASNERTPKSGPESIKGRKSDAGT